MTEVHGKDGMFGNNRLENSIARHARGLGSAEDMSKGIMADVLRHAKDGKLDDDTTLVVVKG